MELQVQELLERIKSDGIDAAQAEAGRIVSSAQAQAKTLVADAEKRAADLEAGASARVEALEKASKLALAQASRDTILALRARVEEFMRAAIHSSTAETLDAGYVAKLLPEVLASLAKDSGKDLTVFFPSKTLESLDGALANRLAKEIGAGVQFKPFDGIDAGFRVAVDASGARYDFSAESVADILASRVNKRLAECVQASLAEGKLS